MTIRKISVALAAASVLTAAAALAGSSPTTFTVSANVIKNCTVTAQNLDFGNYDPVTANSATGSDATATANVSVKCTKGSGGVTVGMDRGANASGGVRRMAGPGGDFLSYVINDDAASDWTEAGGPPATSGSVAYAGFTSASLAVTHQAHGILTKAQDVTVGAYTDTITATVYF
jgi:spore coat protein U-like protein